MCEEDKKEIAELKQSIEVAHNKMRFMREIIEAYFTMKNNKPLEICQALVDSIFHTVDVELDLHSED